MNTNIEVEFIKVKYLVLSYFAFGRVIEFLLISIRSFNSSAPGPVEDVKSDISLNLCNTSSSTSSRSSLRILSYIAEDFGSIDGSSITIADISSTDTSSCRTISNQFLRAYSQSSYAILHDFGVAFFTVPFPCVLTQEREYF